MNNNMNLTAQESHDAGEKAQSLDLLDLFVEELPTQHDLKPLACTLSIGGSISCSLATYSSIEV